MFEVRQAAKVMWFERLYLWIQALEKSVLYPSIILASISMDIEKFRAMEVREYFCLRVNKMQGLVEPTILNQLIM